ncbi:MBL fold metallo-hydrolase [Nitrosophilus kaiyonis]|uniref:MBL fold metallo-hydrolase n=1 Tax=Nitrosophilus kaiyonis TaxID=2930200 RepID=UPI0024905863|nr:MBL fold metallo-hydrolase [Nitrosophilus kaiyonis]
MLLYSIKKIDFKNSDKYKLIYINGRFFSNMDSSKHLTFLNILKWKIKSFDLFDFSSQKSCLEIDKNLKSLNDEKDKIVWLTHSTIYIKVNKKDILIDPVFEDFIGYKRYVKSPYRYDDFKNIDIVLVSHSHYDHCDKRSLKNLFIKFNPLFVLPKFLNILPDKVKKVDLLWFESVNFENFKIVFLPSYHWRRRGLFDKNRSLWGSFLIDTGKITIYFAGDSGYNTHFKDIGENFNIDIAILPIGAYKPSFIMRPSHLNPKEALLAFKDLNAKLFIPVHYGTFKLSDEPLCEPIEVLKKIAKDEKIKVLNPGEIFYLEEIWKK